MTDTSGSSSSSQGYYGWQGLTDGNSLYNYISFMVRQELLRVRTNVSGIVKAVHGGGVGAPPTIDVQIPVAQSDGQGNTTPHATIYGVPTTRHQAGTGTIINDPVVGDTVTMSVHDRDISSLVANNGQPSSPGSFRRHDVADSVCHHGSMLNQKTPTNYIQFMPDGGFTIKDQFGNSITSTSSGVNINGLIIDTKGNLTTPGGVQAGTGTGDSVTLQRHVHPGTQPPTPGT